jgi:hypothetical protein
MNSHIIFGAVLALTATTAATAATQTVTRTGKIIAAVPPGTPLNSNPNAIVGLSDFAIGQAINFSATYDDADVRFRGTIISAFGRILKNPDVSIVGLGNGNPVNAVSLTVGSHSFNLADQICFQDAACIATRRLDFPAGPTLMFHKGKFLGMDSCLIEGGGGFGTGISVCQLVLSSIAPGSTYPAALRGLLGYSRTDIFLIRSATLKTAFVGQFDGPGISAVPEPASWAMMIAGFGLAGAAMRRRPMRVVAA